MLNAATAEPAEAGAKRITIVKPADQGPPRGIIRKVDLVRLHGNAPRSPASEWTWTLAPANTEPGPLTYERRQQAAQYFAVVWRYLYRWERVIPKPWEWQAESCHLANRLADAKVGNDYGKYFGVKARGCGRMQLWDEYVRDDERNIEKRQSLVDSSIAEAAVAALQYLAECGDNANPKITQASREIDRKVFKQLVAQWSELTDRRHPINDCDIGRQIGLSHVQVRERRISRSGRIAARLHIDAPDVWTSDGRPAVEKIQIRKRRQREPYMKLAA
jgi:hypothetical protein